jgi:hypothetical protein
LYFTYIAVSLHVLGKQHESGFNRLKLSKYAVPGVLAKAPVIVKYWDEAHEVLKNIFPMLIVAPVKGSA